MPKIDGFEIYNKIREKDPKVKSIFKCKLQRSMKNLEKHVWYG